MTRAAVAVSTRLTPDLSKYPAVMRKAHLAEIYGVTVRRIEQQLAAGTFPIPRLLHERRPRWNKAVVQRYFEALTYDKPDAREAEPSASALHPEPPAATAGVAR